MKQSNGCNSVTVQQCNNVTVSQWMSIWQSVCNSLMDGAGPEEEWRALKTKVARDIARAAPCPYFVHYFAH